MQIQFLEGEAVALLLSDPQFIASWHQLRADVAATTGFQSPGFVLAWYQSYGAEWSPVLVRQHADDGALLAVWPLAYHVESGVLTHAGQHQAEYHGWLALPAVEKSFVAAAWACLLEKIPFRSLRFKYLPAQASVQLLKEVAGADHVEARLCPRPLMTLDAAQIQASFAKKSNKSRFNRLKKLGALEFRRVRDGAELDRVFDEIIRFYDFRQAAINQTAPFREDEHKRPFHRALFEAAGEELCVTVTYLNERPIAAFWGVMSGKAVHLGMLASSPFLAEHSPGKLHLMQLSDYLVQQGIEVLDLTPGGDPWKERFANSHDEVFDLTLYRSAGQRKKEAMKASLLAQAKASLGRIGVTPAQMRGFVATLKRVNPGAVMRKLQGLRGFTREYRVYRMERGMAANWQADARVHQNDIDGLLCFEPGETWQSRDDYLSSALERLEAGNRAYTICQDGQLAHSGWMAAQTQSNMTEVKQSITLPEGSVTLYDFYSDPAWRGRGFYRITLERMLRDAFADPAIQYAYIMVLADNTPSRRVIEKLGFAYQASYFLEKRGGKERTWQRLVTPADPASSSAPAQERTPAEAQ